MNDPEDVSSYCRLVRCTELLKAKQGRLAPDDFIAFSADHANGPGLNSICRHSPEVRDETSQSAQVAQIDAANPAKTRVWLALGKPCWAWREAGGSIPGMQFRPAISRKGSRTARWKTYGRDPNPARDPVRGRRRRSPARHPEGLASASQSPRRPKGRALMWDIRRMASLIQDAGSKRDRAPSDTPPWWVSAWPVQVTFQLEIQSSRRLRHANPRVGEGKDPAMAQMTMDLDLDWDEGRPDMLES